MFSFSLAFMIFLSLLSQLLDSNIKPGVKGSHLVLALSTMPSLHIPNSPHCPLTTTMKCVRWHGKEEGSTYAKIRGLGKYSGKCVQSWRMKWRLESIG